MTHLITLGHGEGDPGAVGNGTSEDQLLRQYLLPSLKKWAAKSPVAIDFWEGNMYQQRSASRVSASYQSVTEFHMDAPATDSGGHVIIAKGFQPDNADARIKAVVANHFGLWGTGYSFRDDLYNLNVFRDRGIAYRLVELFFITDKHDVDYFYKNVDAVAKDLIVAITGAAIDGTPSTNPGVTPPVAPTPEVKPPVQTTGDTIFLPSSAGKWGIYREGANPVASNIFNYLRPDNFPPGLTYKVVKWVQSNVALIDTGDFGRVQIYVGADTDAVITRNGGTAPSKPVAPAPSQGSVTLPASATSWRVYPTNVAPVVGNEVGALNPSLFGGLTYSIIGRPQANVVTINTRDFGNVNIYVGADSGAILS